MLFSPRWNCVFQTVQPRCSQLVIVTAFLQHEHAQCFGRQVTCFSRVHRSVLVYGDAGWCAHFEFSVTANATEGTVK